LAKVEVRLRDAALAEFGPLAVVIESLVESGGKRIRPALVLLAGVIVNGTRSALSARNEAGSHPAYQASADKLFLQGRRIFRDDTFGDQAFWGGALQLHKAIEGARFGGVGGGVSPKTALALGLKVDSAALPKKLVAAIKAGKVDLNSPATTLALLKLNAVVGLNARSLASAKSVVIAIDRSRSMAGQRLTDAVAAARQFVADKSAADRIAVVVFGSKAVQLTGFSSSTIDADDALRTMAVDSKSGTALYDGLALSTQLLAKQQGRARVVVLLTDGHDVSSKTPLRDAIAGAKRSDVLVYPIGVGASAATRVPLEQMAQSTGGAYHGAATSSNLKSVYSSIAAELRRLTTHVEELHFLDVTGRLAARLVRLAAEAGAPAPDGSIRLLPTLTQGELAAMVGCTRQSANKLLGQFVDDGLIRLERDGIVVVDLPGLVATSRR
jgi:hypothetical protein